MNTEVISLKVSEDTKHNYDIATRYQRDMALRVFGEILTTPEEQLYPTVEDVEAVFRETDRRHEEEHVPPIENIDEILAEYKAKRRALFDKRVAEIGYEAYAAELDAKAENDDES